MNWFRKKKGILIDHQIHAPCGEPSVHLYWEVEQGWKCPACARQERMAKERTDMEALAELIAKKVAKQLKEKKP